MIWPRSAALRASQQQLHPPARRSPRRRSPGRRRRSTSMARMTTSRCRCPAACSCTARRPVGSTAARTGTAARPATRPPADGTFTVVINGVDGNDALTVPAKTTEIGAAKPSARLADDVSPAPTATTCSAAATATTASSEQRRRHHERRRGQRHISGNNGDGSTPSTRDAGNDGTEVNGNPTLGDVNTLEPNAGRVKFQRRTWCPHARHRDRALRGQRNAVMTRSRRTPAWALTRSRSTAAPARTRSPARRAGPDPRRRGQRRPERRRRRRPDRRRPWQRHDERRRGDDTLVGTTATPPMS